MCTHGNYRESELMFFQDNDKCKRIYKALSFKTQQKWIPATENLKSIRYISNY